ncbi:MAG: 2-amino-4-hydroxy-6-hydroxymethyldihydropteridine diphosphokinase [Saprospiraceae bacterium]
MSSSYTYHLSLGSNLGDRVAQLNTARKRIETVLGKINAESSVYETEPWGIEDQPWFLNQVIAVTSIVGPAEVLAFIKRIEKETGRVEGEKWHARHMDIDILLNGNHIINHGDLIIPHPHFHERNFALIPLMDIASQVMHPILHQTVEELYLECRDTGEVYIFNPDEQDNAL